MVGRLRTEAEATSDNRRAYITRTCVLNFSTDTYNHPTCSRDIRYFGYSNTDYKAGQDKSFDNRIHRADDPEKQGAAEFSLQV